MRLKTSLRSLPNCDNGDDNGGGEETEPEPEPTPVLEGDAQETVPTPIVTNTEVEKRYTFRLSSDGSSWFVKNNKTGYYMDKYGDERKGYLKKFGSDKNRAYELIKQKIKKEQENAK